MKHFLFALLFSVVAIKSQALSEVTIRCGQSVLFSFPSDMDIEQEGYKDPQNIWQTIYGNKQRVEYFKISHDSIIIKSVYREMSSYYTIPKQAIYSNSNSFEVDYSYTSVGEWRSIQAKIMCFFE